MSHLVINFLDPYEASVEFDKKHRKIHICNMQFKDGKFTNKIELEVLLKEVEKITIYAHGTPGCGFLESSEKSGSIPLHYYPLMKMIGTNVDKARYTFERPLRISIGSCRGAAGREYSFAARSLRIIQNLNIPVVITARTMAYTSDRPGLYSSFPIPDTLISEFRSLYSIALRNDSAESFQNAIARIQEMAREYKQALGSKIHFSTNEQGDILVQDAYIEKYRKMLINQCTALISSCNNEDRYKTIIKLSAELIKCCNQYDKVNILGCMSRLYDELNKFSDLLHKFSMLVHSLFNMNKHLALFDSPKLLDKISDSVLASVTDKRNHAKKMVESFDQNVKDGIINCYEFIFSNDLSHEFMDEFVNELKSGQLERAKRIIDKAVEYLSIVPLNKAKWEGVLSEDGVKIYKDLESVLTAIRSECLKILEIASHPAPSAALAE